jgi:tetratricopeptide (TPR) repeat protein
MAAVATGADRHGAARAVLEKHARLIDIQCQREKEELGVLKVQRLTRWLILAAVLALLIGLASAIWIAARSNSLVIEPFEVPPALAQRGLNGRVVSARVLDQLAELQRSTESMRGEKSYADNWQDDIKLAIPDTGISLGEAWRTLKAWLGEETRIGGEIFQTPTGFAISTRAGPLSGGTINGEDGDIDRLIREAARSIYKVTQPYRYAISLPEERKAETMAILTPLTGDPSEMERKWAFNGLAVMYRTEGDLHRSLAMTRQALAIDPELLPALGNMVHGQYRLGHEEAASRAVGAFEAAFQHAANGDYDPRISRANLVNTQQLLATMLRDPIASERYALEMEKLGTTSSFGTDAGLARADAAGVRHDHQRAAQLIGRMMSNVGPEQAIGLRYAAAVAALNRAADLRDPTQLAAIVAALERASIRRPGAENPQSYRLLRRAEHAIAYGRAGMAAAARSIAFDLPADCYDCVRARGWAAMAAGDRDGAPRWFSEAVRQGPSLPPAYLDLGEARLIAGDAAGALAEAREAAGRAANWSDPAKLAGDALVALGRVDEAERQYAAAAALAPRWGELHLRWADALWRLGRRDEARAKLAAAAGMELGPAGGRQLARMQAKAARRA